MSNVFKDFVLSKKSLADRLFDEVSDYDIYCELTGIEYDIGRPAISPIRLDDDQPSFSLFIPTKKKNAREEELWWRDFRDGAGDVFKFVKIYADLHYGIKLETKYDIIKFIDNQLELGIFKNNEGKKQPNKYERDLFHFDKVSPPTVAPFSVITWINPDMFRTSMPVSLFSYTSQR